MLLLNTVVRNLLFPIIKFLIYLILLSDLQHCMERDVLVGE